MKDLNINDLIDAYRRGKTIAQVANQANVSGETIRRWFRERDVKIRTKSEAVALSHRVGRTPSALPRNVVENLTALYRSGLTCPQIAAQTGISRGRVYTNLKKAGVEFRDNRQELAAAQSRPITNERRSKSCKRRFARMSSEEKRAYFLNAAKPKRGRKQTTAHKIATAIARQDSLSPRTSPEEGIIIGALESRGVRTVAQLAVGPYNLDVAIKKRTVAVEVENGNAFCKPCIGKTRKRLKYLLDHGWSVLFVIPRKNSLVFPNLAQKILTFLEIAGRDKPFHGQYGMIWGNGKRHSKGCANFDGLPRVPGF